VKKGVYLIVVFIYSCFTNIVFAGDNNKLDSLKNKLNENLADTTRLIILNQIAWDLRSAEPEQALKYANEALKIKFPRENANTFNTLATINRNQGNFSAALDYNLRAVKIREEIKDDNGSAQSYNNIGLIYQDLNNPDRALEYYSKALTIRERNKDKKGLAIVLNNIGMSFNEKKEYDKALDFFLKAKTINEEIKNIKLLSLNFGNIGNVYRDKKEYDKALLYYQKAFKIFKELNNKGGMAQSRIDIGNVAEKNGNYSEASANYNEALSLAKELGDKQSIKNALEGLSLVYEKQKNYPKALEFFKEFSSLKDTLYNADAANSIAEMGTKYETDKKQKEIELLNKDKDLQDAQIKQQQTFRNFLFGVVTLILVLAFVLFRNNQNQRKANTLLNEQKLEIEHQKEEIIDSINYAQRIQRSLLASSDVLNNNLKEYFIFFKPKDIVSGDFYWATKLSNGNFVMATADSTGHGVPGAIMSMLNISCLNEAVSKNIVEPDKLLYQTRKTIIETLRNDGSADGGKDGMDCSLLSFDFNNNKLSAAAANNPIWIVRGTELIEIKADKMPVGKHDRDTEPFTQHTIDLQKGDIVYTLTDGFPDQFGGEKGKKFMSKKLKELLLENAHKPLAEQQQMLETTFKNWVGDLEQIDDVTIIGVKV
jgi:serine phosphatase RsbU (regulator of sigma subunit)/Tfp pilus assembly protein PilF